MGDNKLSIDNMMEFAMGLSMASLFTKAMNNTFENNQRIMNNNELNLGASKYIYAVIDGAQRGPYSLDEVVQLIKSGSITPQTYIWKAGMPEWMMAENVTDIAPNLSMVPPTFNPGK